MPLRVKEGKSINFREPSPNEKIINVPQIIQEQSNWCWAACVEMVIRYYNEPATQQCEFANELFKGLNVARIPPAQTATVHVRHEIFQICIYVSIYIANL